MKNSLIGLLAFSTISLISFPALADQATVQTSEQVSTQVGNNNSSTQRSRQSNISTSRKRGQNIGTAQDSFQDSFQEGNRNNTNQILRQRNVSRPN